MQLVIIFLLSINISFANLIDKTIAIYGDKIITLSKVERIKSNIAARNKISNIIYKKSKYSTKEITELLIERLLIRARLKTVGYIISDEQVESQIKTTEQRLGVDRKALLEFLKSYNISFNEYFDLIRESIEYNLFIEKVIRPLVSISEQEIKEKYQRQNKNNGKNYSYTLIDFYVNKKYVSKRNYKNLIPDLKKFQNSGSWPHYLRKMETNVLQDIQESSLSDKIKKSVIRTKIQSFTRPVIIGKQVHIFFIKDKKIADSEAFLANKNAIQNKIFEEKIGQLSSTWFSKERKKYFIKTFY